MYYILFTVIYFILSFGSLYAQVADSYSTENGSVITNDDTVVTRKKEIIKVAVILPLQGENAISGLEIYKSVPLIQSLSEDIKFDSQFGSQYKFQVIRKDDACSPKKAVQVAKEIIKQKDILFVIGHYCSTATLAAAPYYAKAGIIQITPYSTDPSITERGHETLFRMSGRNDRYAEVASDWLLDFKRKYRIGVMFSSKDSFGLSTAKLVMNALDLKTRSQNKRYVDLATQKIRTTNKYTQHVSYDLSYFENDLEGLLRKIKNDKVGVIFFGGSYFNLSHDILKGIKKINPNMIILGGPSLQNYDFWKQSKGYANRVLFVLTKDVTRDISQKELNAINRTRKFKKTTDEEGIDEAIRRYSQEASRNIFAENRIYKNRNDFMLNYFKKFNKFPDLYISHLYASFEIIKAIALDEDNANIIIEFKKSNNIVEKRLLGLEIARYMKNKGFGTSEEYVGFRTILGVVNFSEVGDWKNAEYTIYQWLNIKQERNWLFDENDKKTKFVDQMGDFKKLF